MLARAIFATGLIVGCSVATSSAQSADDIAAQLEAHNAQRRDAGLHVSCDRDYSLLYQGFLGKREAGMKVHAEQNGTQKTFTVTEESGSAVLRSHVLHKLLEGEQEASRGKMQAQTTLSRANYDFALDGIETTSDGAVYRLTVTPRTQNKYLWRGRIWVDGRDYAVQRAEGQPARMPSWWTTASHFEYVNQKLDTLWLPERNESDTTVRLGGKAHLSISYTNCRILPPSPQEAKEAQ